ncbi:MAG: hypothetical protein QOH40_2420 [Arthrobacter pascens]|nr:hypothetical protein [Arthrobacter pascens]
MDWQGWALFGLLATGALTAVMIAAQMAGWTRLDLPLVLGTLLTRFGNGSPMPLLPLAYPLGTSAILIGVFPAAPLVSGPYRASGS